ncbi:MAG TPA: hypothetical protein VHN74_21095 [Candidatus Angelobacter sp.]|nr:hypothetical protein [Candidatus Angelobacter sp.]
MTAGPSRSDHDAGSGEKTIHTIAAGAKMPAPIRTASSAGNFPDVVALAGIGIDGVVAGAAAAAVAVVPITPGVLAAEGSVVGEAVAFVVAADACGCAHGLH